MGQSLWDPREAGVGIRGCSAEQKAGIPLPLAQCPMLAVHPWRLQLVQGLLSRVSVQLLAPSAAQ